MAIWGELNSRLEIGYRIFKVGEITSAMKASFECGAEVIELLRLVYMAVRSKLYGTLEVGYRIFDVSRITSATKPRRECDTEAVET